MPIDRKELKEHVNRLVDESLRWLERAGVCRRPAWEGDDLGYIVTGGLVTDRTFEAHPQSIMTYDLIPGWISLERSLRLGYNSQATFCGLRGTIQDGGVSFTQMISLSMTESPIHRRCDGIEAWRPFKSEVEDA